jgi:hypothetical protein
MGEILAGFAALFSYIKAQLDAGKISEDEARAMAIQAGVKITETDSDTELAAYLKVFEDGNG